LLTSEKRSGDGRIRVISTSKIKKITVVKKKRREKGRRAVIGGSNPHSNGEGFSRLELYLLLKIKLVVKQTKGIIKEREISITIRTSRWVFIIGSYMYLILRF
jgi:hypothetical protein